MTINRDCYMQEMLYTNLTVTKKAQINTQKIEKNKSKYNTKENQQTMKERKTRMDQKQSPETTTKQVIKWQ